MNRVFDDDVTGESATDAAFDEIVCRVVSEIEAGKPVDLAAITADQPEYAERLRQLLPALQAMVDLGAAKSVAASPASENGLSERRGESAVGVLGDFRIIREIGRGGMGVVYEASQLSLGRRVALKVLPFAALLDRQQLARFKNEARAAAALDHPNIVAVYFSHAS